MCDASGTPKTPECKLFEHRFDYAWNYFDFHAKQRTTIFNFFLIFIGFILNAYATIYAKADANPPLLIGLAIFGIFATICFIVLDRRNEELVDIAEAILIALENDSLFKDYTRKVPARVKRSLFGINQNKNKREDRQLGILEHQPTSCYSHAIWIRLFQYLVISAFIGLVIFALILCWSV